MLLSPIVLREIQRLSYDGDDPFMYDSLLSSCRAATCWRGACDAFMYFENRRLEEAHTPFKSLQTSMSHKIDLLDLGYAIIRSAKSTKSNNIPDPNPMPIKDGLRDGSRFSDCAPDEIFKEIFGPLQPK